MLKPLSVSAPKDDIESGLMQLMVTVTHSNLSPEFLACVRRGPFAVPTETENIEYLLGRVPKTHKRALFEQHPLEHVISYQRRIAAIKKTFLPPIRVHALVDWEGLNTSADTSYGVDKMSEITVHFHKRRLTEDQDLFVREGDFVLYGSIYYEIVTLAEPAQIFGQVDHKMEVVAKCVRAREGLFDAS